MKLELAGKVSGRPGLMRCRPAERNSGPVVMGRSPEVATSGDPECAYYANQQLN